MSEVVSGRLIRAAAIVVLLVVLVGNRVWAQPNFGLGVTASPNPVVITQALTYTINVTNQTPVLLQNVVVSNQFSAPVQFIAATNSSPGDLTTNANTIIFRITSLASGQPEFLTLVILPRAFGNLTNTVTVASLTTTNVTTNVTTQVIAGQSELGITIAGPAQAVLVNDWMTYTLTVTNQGPDAAPNVIVSNNFPADVKLISITPSNQVFAVTNNILHWSAGTLASGAFSRLNVTVQPTNTGVGTFSASVSAANVLDTNTVNDTTSTNIDVGPLVAGSLIATNASAMTFNPQTGLMEQTVGLVNIGTNAVASARIIVTGLTNRLFNAVGTNDGNPFVVYGATLETNQPVNLLMEYFVPTRLPIVVADSQLHAFGAPAVNLAPPGGTPFSITLITNLSSGHILIEFKSSPGGSYTVLYADNSSFSNELAAQPAIVAPADRVQWLDDGPPKTVSPPAGVSSRFYRVIQNQ